MSKKLVKTAKQQFEERLRELGNHVAKEINGETFHSGIDKEGHFHILRIGDADIEYSEFDYGCTLLELYNNEEFLDKLATEFAIGREGIKPILEWWSDAEKNHEPFTMADIVQFAPVKAFVEFEDLYEDVEDAKDQWEEDAKDAEKVSLEGSAYENVEGAEMRVEGTDEHLKIYLFDGIVYNCYIYPPLKYLRKDADFLTSIKECILEFNLVPDALLMQVDEWARGKVEEFPIPFTIVLASDYDLFEKIGYAVGKERPEHPKNFSDFIKLVDMDDLNSLKRRVILKIRMLYDMGYVVDTDKLELGDFIGYVDGTGACLDSYDVGIYEGADGKLGLDFNGTNEWRDLKKTQWLKYGDAVGGIHQVCIEHLHAILQAMVLPK